VRKIAITTLLVLLCTSTFVWAETDQAMVQADKMGKESLVMVRWQIDELMGMQDYNAIGICVKLDDGDAIVMLMGMSRYARGEEFTKLRTVRAEAVDEEFDTTLMGVDRSSGLGFVRVSGNHGLTPVNFVSGTELTAGAEVASVGMLAEEMGLKTYVGKAYVSTTLRKPEVNYIVTGGSLTNLGSIVLDDQGQAIGLVNQQPYAPYQAVVGNQPTTMGLRGMMWTQGFLPADEFAEVLERIPATPDDVAEMPWIGSLGTEPVDPDMWVIYGLTSPGIKLSGVVPTRAADNAGLKDTDIIIAMDGERIEEMPTGDLTLKQFYREFNRHKVGDEVTFTVVTVDDTEPKDVTMTVDRFPTVPYQARQLLDRTFGAALREKVEMDRLVDKTDSADQEGLFVMMVAQESPAARGGLRAGDLIAQVNGEDVRTVEAYEEAVRAALDSLSQSVNMTVWRGGEELSLLLRTGK
jgi:S1-C subfamily serine protease